MKIPEKHDLFSIYNEYRLGKDLQEQLRVLKFVKIVQEIINNAYIDGFNNGILSVKGGVSNGKKTCKR